MEGLAPSIGLRRTLHFLSSLKLADSDSDAGSETMQRLDSTPVLALMHTNTNNQTNLVLLVNIDTGGQEPWSWSTGSEDHNLTTRHRLQLPHLVSFSSDVTWFVSHQIIIYSTISARRATVGIEAYHQEG